MPIKILIICLITSLIGYIGDYFISEVKLNKKELIKKSLSAIIIGVCFGLTMNYFYSSVELVIVASLITSFFYNGIIKELKEIIDKSSEITEKVIDKKLEEEKKDKDE